MQAPKHEAIQMTDLSRQNIIAKKSEIDFKTKLFRKPSCTAFLHTDFLQKISILSLWKSMFKFRKTSQRGILNVLDLLTSTRQIQNGWIGSKNL